MLRGVAKHSSAKGVATQESNTVVYTTHTQHNCVIVAYYQTLSTYKLQKYLLGSIDKKILSCLVGGLSE